MIRFLRVMPYAALFVGAAIALQSKDLMADAAAPPAADDADKAALAFAESARNEMAGAFPEVADLGALDPARAAAIEHELASVADNFPPCGHDTPLQRQAALLCLKLNVKTALEHPLYPNRRPDEVRTQIDRLLETARTSVEKRYESLDAYAAFQARVLTPALDDLRERLYAGADSPFDGVLAQPASEKVLQGLMAGIREAAAALPQADGWAEHMPVDFELAGTDAMRERLQRYSAGRLAGMHAAGDIRDWQGEIRAAFAGENLKNATPFSLDETLMKEMMPICEAAEKECAELTERANAAEMEHLRVVNEALLFATGAKE